MCAVKFAITFLMVLMQESICLRVTEVAVPGYRMRGETALLRCQFDLERDNLYSVKWYKDNEEFYRYMPKLTPPHHSYRIEGIKVDHHQSDDKKVTLKAVTLKSTGMYRCEVSAEAPSFASAHGEGRLEVVYLPKDGPHISGQEPVYQPGDLLLLNCTSGRSHPAATLHWFLNDEKIVDVQELLDYPLVSHQHGLLTTVLGLRVRLRARHLSAGALRVRCAARVSPVLWTADMESLLERVAPLLDNREALVLVKSGASKATSSVVVSLLALAVSAVR